jgi:hypothetical protein
MPAKCNNIGLPLAMVCPSLHQRAPLFERIATAIGALSLVAGDMRKRCLGYFARERRDLAAPVTERASEAVHRRVSIFMRRKIISMAIPLSGVPGRCPVKTYSLVRAVLSFSRIASALELKRSNTRG